MGVGGFKDLDGNVPELDRVVVPGKSEVTSEPVLPGMRFVALEFLL